MKKIVFVLSLLVLCSVFSGCYFSTKLNEVFEVNPTEFPVKKPVVFVENEKNPGLLQWVNVPGAKSYKVLYAKFSFDEFVSLQGTVNIGEEKSSYFCTEKGFYKVLAVGEKSSALSDYYEIY